MIGSPQSKVLVRIYDKAAEKHCDPGTHWVRVEIQMRDDRALQFLKVPLPIGETFSGVLLNYLRYVIPDDEDTNKWRWQMTEYWLNLLTVVSPISIYQSPGMDYNVDRCKKYVVNQAGNAIDCLIKVYGYDEFLHMIKNRDVRPNPKYNMIIAQHKYERLALKIQTYFGGIQSA